MFENIPDLDAALDQADQPLIGMNLLLKAIEPENEEAPWRFAGIASDESEDVEGDKILRKALDVTYAAQRGYVNWDHSRKPADQIGFLTKCEVLNKSRIGELRKSFGDDISDTATVYVEGEFYKHIPAAKETFALLKSVPAGATGPGLSLDGAVARDRTNGGVVKAFVRGVAITPAPAHPQTVARLKKSLQIYDTIQGLDGQLPPDLPASIAHAVVTELRKSADEKIPPALSHDEAVMFVLRKRPHFTYELASKLVRYTMQKLERGV